MRRVKDLLRYGHVNTDIIGIGIGLPDTWQYEPVPQIRPHPDDDPTRHGVKTVAEASANRSLTRRLTRPLSW
ncbi:unnamed protein product (mitochondrion) [Plasmodiophora brassicae]|uniref:Uncharacterized protein n=1 Tax=Plasmodiophora brassicae TaxID=37360 RepID=A0A3P3YIV9_PLABS|nr:unnamed protein product [Plasmodiophora brassicae]